MMVQGALGLRVHVSHGEGRGDVAGADGIDPDLVWGVGIGVRLCEAENACQGERCLSATDRRGEQEVHMAGISAPCLVVA